MLQAGASFGIAEGVYRGLTKDHALAAAFAASQARTQQLELDLKFLHTLHLEAQNTSSLLVLHLEVSQG